MTDVASSAQFEKVAIDDAVVGFAAVSAAGKVLNAEGSLAEHSDSDEWGAQMLKLIESASPLAGSDALHRVTVSNGKDKHFVLSLADGVLYVTQLAELHE